MFVLEAIAAPSLAVALADKQRDASVAPPREFETLTHNRECVACKAMEPKSTETRRVSSPASAACSAVARNGLDLVDALALVALPTAVDVPPSMNASVSGGAQAGAGVDDGVAAAGATTLADMRPFAVLAGARSVCGVRATGSD